MPEDERALYADQIAEMRNQIKDAQGYILQIRFEGQDAKFHLSPSYVTSAQRPASEVVEEVAGEVLDDLGDDTE